MSTGQRVDVKRFVRARSAPSAVQQDGFLADPETPFGKFAAPETKTVDAAFGRGCVVVLGEPGIGKSDAFSARQRIAADAMFIDLRWEDASAALRDDRVIGWQRGERPLHLVVDSLDEATEPRFASLLIGVLRKGPIESLTLELACRVAEWPRVLEEELPRLFGPENFKDYVLEPLRRRDVVAFAEQMDLDAELFLSAVAQLDLQPLAARPLTLRMLLKIFQADGALPSEAAELFEKACLVLCEEHSSSAGKVAFLESHERLAVAEWLAVASLICKRSVFLARVSSSEPVHAHEIDERLIADVVPEVTPAHVRDALFSGLFTSVGAQRFGWVHQTLSEFLAARWMTGRLTLDQRRNLITHPEDRDAIPPQLWGLTGWLCCMDSNLASWVACTIPELILAAPSPPAITDADRSAAVERYIARVASREAINWWWQSYQLQRFDHPGLPAQLTRILMNAEADVLVQRVALDLAEASSAIDLCDAILEIAERPSLPPHVRAAAVEAAWTLADDKNTRVSRMLALAKRDPTDDDEQIRAAVIEALWPVYLSAADLLNLLLPPRRSNFIGSYQTLFWKLPVTFGPPAVVTALQWARQHYNANNRTGDLATERLVQGTCRRALEFLDHPDVYEELGRTAGMILADNGAPFDGRSSGSSGSAELSDGARRRVVAAIVQHATSWDGAFRLVQPYGQPPLVTGDDVAWMIEQFRSSSGEVRGRWADVVRDTNRWCPTQAGLELVLDEIGDAQHSPLLHMPRFVELDSQEVMKTREEYQAGLREERAAVRARRREDDLPDVVASAQLAADGHLESWWRVVCMSAKQAGHRTFCSPKEFLDWQDHSDETRALLIQAGRRFLREYHPPYHMWIHERGAVYYPAFAAVVTLVLLQDLDSNWITDNESALATTWAAAVVGFDVHQLWDDAQREGYRQLAAWATRQAAPQMAAALRTLIRRERRRGSADLRVLHYLPAHPALGRVVREALDSGYVALGAFEDLLAALLRLDSKSGLDCARRQLDLELGRGRLGLAGAPLRAERAGVARWVRSPFHGVSSMTRGRGFKRKAQVCALLMRDGADGWRLLWQALRRDPAIAKVVAPLARDRDDMKRFSRDLEPKQVADLYQVLSPHGRASTDFDHRWDTPQLHVLLDVLVELSSFDALHELKRLRDRFPADDSVAFRLPQAVRRYHDATWAPVAFDQVVDLAGQSDRRLVGSNAQLLDAVVDALRLFEYDLHAETPTVARLWNYSVSDRKKSYWPKDENDFADEVKLSLQQTLRGVIVNREVEIRPTDDARAGQHVDLLVEAIEPSTKNRLGVVVEVKGSWHKELETALEDQLVARYLTGGRLTHGLYLVGWFTCTNWSDDDHRRATCRKRDRTHTTALLQAQAARASNDVRTIRVVVVDASFVARDGG